MKYIFISVLGMAGRQEDGSGRSSGEQPFSHTEYYNLIGANATDPTHEAHSFHSWNPYSAMPQTEASSQEAPHDLGIGFGGWSAFGNSTAFSFPGGLFGSVGQHPNTPSEAAEYSSPTQLASEGLNLDFLPSSDRGRELYADAVKRYEEGESAPTSPFSMGTYHPFGTTEVFSSVESMVQSQFPTPEQSPEPSRQPTQASKKSYSEVAKHKLAANGKKETASGLCSVKDSFGDSCLSSASSTSSTSGIKPKKVKSNVSRSHSVPSGASSSEPSPIHPDSRYGLDTFEDPLKVNPQHSHLSSGGSSRKGSCSSEDVFIEKPTSKMSQSSKTAKPDKKPKNTAKKEAKAFFDPKRIFKNTEKSATSSSPETSFIPNNQQNFNDEADAVLNNGKMKSNWKTTSAKYINNNLRDDKKQTNTEKRNVSYNESKQKEGMAGPQSKAKRSDKKSTSTMTDDAGLARGGQPRKIRKNNKSQVQHMISKFNPLFSKF